MHGGRGEGEGVFPANGSQLVHHHAAGIGKSEHARGFVKGFAGRVVPRLADTLEIGIAVHLNE